VLWEELSSRQLGKAAEDSKGVCVLPLGVVEKHGDHLPLGTDMYIGRAVSKRASELEPAVVFPYYFLGQIMEGAHYPGTIALQGETIFQTLMKVCDEINRAGFSKILIVSSHGGNTAFLNFFAQSMLGTGRDYMVYITSVLTFRDWQVKELQQKYGEIDLASGKHAGLKETAIMLAIAPQLVHMKEQDPALSVSLERSEALNQKDVTTGFDWYGKYPYHYAGSHLGATPEMGEDILKFHVANLVESIKAVKEDVIMTALAKEFYSDSMR